jgi:phosphatidylglycerophosphate synthase
MNYIPDWIKPNFLSGLRLLLVIPLFIIGMSTSESIRQNNFLNLLIIISIFCIGVFSDLIDGTLARYRKNETLIGLYFDPLTDKIFILPFILILYQFFPNLNYSLFFFYLYKVVLILILLLQLYTHFNSTKFIRIQNAYRRIMISGYLLMAVILIWEFTNT